MGNNKQTVPVIVNRIMAMQAGFQKNFTAKQSLPVEGVAMLQPAIIGQLGAELQVVTDAESARNTLTQKVAARKAAAPGTQKFLAALESALKSQFGSGDPRLQDFGIKLPKPRKKLTAEEKTLAVAAARDTKQARGIMGKKQRASITTTGKRGLALVNPEGGIVTGLLTGPTPPGSGTPVSKPTPVTAPAPASAPASTAGTPAATPAPAGNGPAGSSGQ